MSRSQRVRPGMRRRAAAPRWTVLGIAGVAALLGACGEPESPLDQSERAIAPGTRPEPAAPMTAPGLDAARLGNASVTLPALAGERVALRNGGFQRESPPRVVTLDAGSITVADFDTDGSLEAAAIVTVLEGRPIPGELPNLVSHIVVFGAPQGLQEGVLQLPVRTRVADIRAVRGNVEVDLVVFRAGDRPCCPSGRETRLYRYSNGTFNPL